MIGHSLGRKETCFGPSTQGAEIRYSNIKIHPKSRFCAILKKRGVILDFEIHEALRILTSLTFFSKGY